MSTDATIFPVAADTGSDQAVPEHAEADGQDEGVNPFGEPDTAEEIEARALRIVEALLFAASQPMTEAALAQHLPEGIDIGALLERLGAMYQGRGVSLTQVAGGYAFRTAPDLARHLTIYRSVTRRFSRAALEALAIIAYHQPITRAEIETIRGVSLSRGTLDQLLEAEWIKPKGRRAVPGRPVTWVTTPQFLSHFGLDSLDDLPGVEELRASGLLEPVTAGLPNDETTGDDEGGEEQGEDEDAEDEEPLSDA
jgi:segregation and condensation protein B